MLVHTGPAQTSVPDMVRLTSLFEGENLVVRLGSPTIASMPCLPWECSLFWLPGASPRLCVVTHTRLKPLPQRGARGRKPLYVCSKALQASSAHPRQVGQLLL